MLPWISANYLDSEDLTLNHEIITFSSSAPHPIYTLSASSSPPSTVHTTRTHPSQTATQIPICVSELSTPSRQDPLLCSIFPKLAGLMALDQSSTVAVDRKINRSASDVLQNEAITQAQDCEASLLLWDADSNRYCIMHPTLLDNSATSLPITITPNPSAPTLIIISAPETETPLLTLDLQALTLKLHTHPITALPSLYILDTLVIAILTLLLHLHRSCATPRAIQPATFAQGEENQEAEASAALYFPPPPPSLHSNRSRSQLRQPKRSARERSQSRGRPSLFRSAPSIAGTTRTHSALASPTPWANNASTAHYSATISSPSPYGHHSRDIELGDLSTPADGTSPSLANIKQKPPKQLFSVDDESLSSGTRTVLRCLYWGFEMVYWVLGVMVQILAAGVVAGGKFVGKL